MVMIMVMNVYHGTSLDLWFSYLAYDEEKFKEIQAKSDALLKGQSKKRR